MTSEQEPSFDPKSFLAKVGEGRSIGRYSQDRIVFTQGDPADSVFYIQKGKVKVGRARAPPTGAPGRRDWVGRRSSARASKEGPRSSESTRSIVDGFDDAASYVQELTIKRGKTALPNDPVKRRGIGQHL